MSKGRLFVCLSGKTGSGKSNVAEILQNDFDFHIVRITDIIVDICHLIFHTPSLSVLDENPDAWNEPWKPEWNAVDLPSSHEFRLTIGERPLKARELIQRFGFAVRKQFPDAWLLPLFHNLANVGFYKTFERIVIPDVRLCHEVSRLRQLPTYEIWRIENPLLVSLDNDATETELDKLGHWDAVITNPGNDYELSVLVKNAWERMCSRMGIDLQTDTTKT